MGGYVALIAVFVGRRNDGDKGVTMPAAAAGGCIVLGLQGLQSLQSLGSFAAKETTWTSDVASVDMGLIGDWFAACYNAIIEALTAV